MKGVVEVYRGEEKILEESNMLMDNLGSQIAFWMSLPRGFGEIPSAKAIYDTSNYTVRAASLGKDAAGYSRHAHSSNVGQTSSVISVRSKFVDAINYDIEKESTYLDPSISSILATYTVLPEDSNPIMQRLETASTKTPAQPSLLDLGHNPNLTISGGGYVRAGCYSTSAATRFRIVKADGTVLAKPFAPNTEGFNSEFGIERKAIDTRGFIRVNVADIVDGNSKQQEANSASYGLILTYTPTHWNPSQNLFGVDHFMTLVPQDVVCLNFFGGVYTIGLWGFDIKKMMEKGMYPPYQQYPIDDIEYKLYARKTFTKDLTKFDNLEGLIEKLDINWRFTFV
jgi:hypothetical protein